MDRKRVNHLVQVRRTRLLSLSEDPDLLLKAIDLLFLFLAKGVEVGLVNVDHLYGNDLFRFDAATREKTKVSIWYQQTTKYCITIYTLGRKSPCQSALQRRILVQGRQSFDISPVWMTLVLSPGE